MDKHAVEKTLAEIQEVLRRMDGGCERECDAKDNGRLKFSIHPLAAVLAVLMLAMTIMIMLATAASAQGRNCAPREVVVERLAEKYGESRQAIGLGENVMMETFASNESGSWTIIATTPNGISCLMASGQAYEVVAEALVDSDPT